jgi:hypothetical protein
MATKRQSHRAPERKKKELGADRDPPTAKKLKLTASRLIGLKPSGRDSAQRRHRSRGCGIA